MNNPIDPRDNRQREADAMESYLLDALGPAELCCALCRALDIDTRTDLFSYFLRVYDLQDDYSEARRDPTP